MGERVNVRVVATDPVSEMGVRAQLRGRPELRVLEPEDTGSAPVTLIVVDETDETAVRLMREARCSGRSSVVLVPTRIDDGGLLAAVEAGAGAIVPRVEASPERLASAATSVARGCGDVSADLLGRLLDQVGNLQRTVLASRGLGPTGLSDREVQVLRLVADGQSNKQIGDALGLSALTVKSHLARIARKLGTGDRAEMVALAMRAGVIR